MVNGLTIGKLKEWIKKFDLSDDTIIVLQRIEDVYFEKHGWQTIKREGYWSSYARRWNKDIDEGKYLDKEKYPLMKPENLVKVPEEDIEKSKLEYFTCQSPVFYDKEFLYLDGHI